MGLCAFPNVPIARHYWTSTTSICQFCVFWSIFLCSHFIHDCMVAGRTGGYEVCKAVFLLFFLLRGTPDSNLYPGKFAVNHFGRARVFQIISYAEQFTRPLNKIAHRSIGALRMCILNLNLTGNTKPSPIPLESGHSAM